MGKLERRMFDEIYSEDRILYRPFYPSRWTINAPESEEVVQVKMTCGGGFGGACWYEYITDADLRSLVDNGNGLFEVKTIDGKKVLNPAYIVEARMLKIVTVKFYSTNPHYEQGEYTYKYLFAPNAYATLGER